MAQTPKKSRAGKGSKARGRKASRTLADFDLGTDKLYFKIGEVAEIVGVAAHVLRYWETEFPLIKPQKSRSQQRVYRRKDVENLLRIKHLLYARKFTIAGARQELRGGVSKIERAQVSGLYKAQRSLEIVREQMALLAATIRADGESAQLEADPAHFLRTSGGARSLVRGESQTASQAIVARPEREPR